MVKVSEKQQSRRRLTSSNQTIYSGECGD